MFFGVGIYVICIRWGGCVRRIIIYQSRLWWRGLRWADTSIKSSVRIQSFHMDHKMSFPKRNSSNSTPPKSMISKVSPMKVTHRLGIYQLKYQPRIHRIYHIQSVVFQCSPLWFNEDIVQYRKPKLSVVWGSKIHWVSEYGGKMSLVHCLPLWYWAIVTYYMRRYNNNNNKIVILYM